MRSHTSYQHGGGGADDLDYSQSPDLIMMHKQMHADLNELKQQFKDEQATIPPQ